MQELPKVPPMSGCSLPALARDASDANDSPLIVVLVAAAFFMENLDVTIIATALPQMARLDVFSLDRDAGAQVSGHARRSSRRYGSVRLSTTWLTQLSGISHLVVQALFMLVADNV
jgi:hypothetical protein